MEQDNAFGGHFSLNGDPVACAAVLDALRKVADPEVGENIVELGLVESIAVAPGEVTVVLVMTSATCPMGDYLVDEAFRAVQKQQPDADIFVRPDHVTVWTPERMSPGARRRLGWDDV